MRSVDHPTPQLSSLAVAAGLATLGGIMVLGSHNVLLLVAAPFAGVAMVLLARYTTAALIVMVVVEATNLSGVLGPTTKIPFFQLSLLLGLVAIGFAIRQPELRGRLNAWTGICAGILGVYLATQVVATIGSVDPTTSFSEMRRALLDCGFVMIVLILTQMTSRPWTVAAAVVISFAALSLLTLIDQVFFGGTVSFGGFSTVTEALGVDITTLRYGGPLPDSNFWGRHLVMGLPLAVALLSRAARAGNRASATLWAMSILAQLAGIYLTQSRGTFVAATAAIAMWFIASDRSTRRRGLRLMPLALLALLAVPGVGNRLLAVISDVQNSNIAVSVDPSVLGRLAAQQEAWMMFKERPYFGFGPATFPGEVIEFAGRVPLAVRDPTNAPHNLYLEFGAQSGVFGLMGWATVIFGFLAVVVLGIAARPRSADRSLQAGVCAAIVAWSIASIALHMAYFRTFGLVLALAGALAQCWPVPRAAVQKVVRGLAALLLCGSAGLLAGWAVLAASSTPAVTVAQRVTMLPVGELDGWYSYALDIRSRIEFLPTMAVLTQDPDSPVEVVADPVRGLLTYSATADSVGAARDELQLGIANADAALRSALGYQQYSLRTVGSMTVEVGTDHSLLAMVVSVVVGTGVALQAGFFVRRILGRRRMSAQPDNPSAQELSSA